MKQKWVKWNPSLSSSFASLTPSLASSSVALSFCISSFTTSMTLLCGHSHLFRAWQLDLYHPFVQYINLHMSKPTQVCHSYGVFQSYIIAELTTICFTLAAILHSQITPDTQLHQPRGVAQTNVLLVPDPCLDKRGGLHQWGHPALNPCYIKYTGLNEMALLW